MVPADDKKVRNLLVARTIVDALEALPLEPPRIERGKLDALQAALEAQLAAEEAEGARG